MVYRVFEPQLTAIRPALIFSLIMANSSLYKFPNVSFNWLQFQPDQIKSNQISLTWKKQSAPSIILLSLILIILS